MTLGFPTIVIPAIQGGEGHDLNDIVLNKEEISWFSSINLICVPLGCIFSGILAQPIGKRKAMQFVNFPILASWLLFHFSTKPGHLYGALCLSGLGGGLMEAPVLTYVAEIAEPRFRGILSALGSTCVITGIFIQFIMGSLMDWRTVAAVSSAFPVVSIIALFFVPESPTWLIKQQRYRDAIKALQWLRGWVPEYKIEGEFNRLYEELIIQPAVEEETEHCNQPKNILFRRLKMFRKRSFVVPFLLVAYTFFTGHFSGKTTLQTYAVQIFHALKVPINKYYATILLGVAEMIATIMCVVLIHFTGKRPLVLISTIGVGVCFFGTATYAHYLKLVPGFAVNNVVVNASSIVSKENIISQDNITRIFEIEEKDFLLQKNVTILKDCIDAKTNFNKDVLDDYSEGRTKRGISQVVSHNNEGFDFFPTKLENNSIKTKEIQEVSQLLPSTKQVVEEILLPIPKQQKNYFAWIPLILLLGSAFFAHLGIRMIPWILIGEVFPADVRSTASGLVSGLGYLFGFLANKLFLQMLNSITMQGTFWLYSAIGLTGAVVLYFILPETEGRTLGEIQSHFSKKTSINLLKTNSNVPAKLSKLKNMKNSANSMIEANMTQIKPSDSAPKSHVESIGQFNLGYEENNTTHL